MPTPRIFLLLAAACLGVASLRAAPLSADEQKLSAYADAHGEELLALLERTVKISSSTEDLAGVRAVGAVFKPEFEALGFATRWIEMPPEMKRAGHLFAERTGTRGRRLLLIGHLDTVLPGGKFHRDGAKLTGSGVNDMKGGDLVVLYALKALQSIGALDGTRIVVVFTGDEESSGRPTAIARRDLIDAAKRSDLALAFETGFKDTATVARRGSSGWKLEVTGMTGHSRGIFSDFMGDGAIFEAARILDQFRTQLRTFEGMTFNPALIVGGTEAELKGTHGTAAGKNNVVAQTVLVNGDLRASSEAQLEAARAKMREIVARSLRRTSAKITFEDGYPAMVATDGNLSLLKKFDEVSRDLGYGPVAAADPAERGAADVSHIAPFIPALDSLGARGEGAHAPNESADAASFPEMVKRTAVLIYRLTR
jgi:glutamate carboxypeptidase